MGEGATDLADLLNSAASSPGGGAGLPQSTTFAPITTGGGNPFIAPQPANSGSSPQYTSQSGGYGSSLSTLRYAVKNLITYFGFFLAALIISLSTPRSLLLQYIPNTYTSGGIVSYTGAAVLAGVAVSISYIVGTLGNAVV